MNEQAGICVEIENSLPLFVGGDLEADAMAEIERHIALCATCAARAAEAGRARATLISALKLRASGPDLWSGVRAVLAEDGFFLPRAADQLGKARSSAAPVAARTAPAATTRARRWQLVPLSLAAAAAVVFGVWVGSHFFARGTPDGRKDGTVVLPQFADNGPSRTMPAVPESTIPPSPSAESPDSLLAGNKDSLRPLRPGEPRLSHGSEIFTPPQDAYWNGEGRPFDDPSAGSPVGLRQVGRRP